jgi:hypothetical protein
VHVFGGAGEIVGVIERLESPDPLVA